VRKQVAKLVQSGCDLGLRQIHVVFECLDNPRTVKQLSESGNGKFDKPAVSRAVQRLRELGYVERREHPDDRRSVLVSLTPAGRTFAKNIAKE